MGRAETFWGCSELAQNLACVTHELAQLDNDTCKHPLTKSLFMF